MVDWDELAKLLQSTYWGDVVVVVIVVLMIGWLLVGWLAGWLGIGDLAVLSVVPLLRPQGTQVFTGEYSTVEEISTKENLWWKEIIHRLIT
jgi:hypothetical protein